MAVSATTAWARKAKLKTAGKTWEIQFRLLANGKHPTDSTTSLRSTELWMKIARDIYCAWPTPTRAARRWVVSVARSRTSSTISFTVSVAASTG